MYGVAYSGGMYFVEICNIYWYKKNIFLERLGLFVGLLELTWSMISLLYHHLYIFYSLTLLHLANNSRLGTGRLLHR